LYCAWQQTLAPTSTSSSCNRKLHRPGDKANLQDPIGDYLIQA